MAVKITTKLNLTWLFYLVASLGGLATAVFFQHHDILDYIQQVFGWLRFLIFGYLLITFFCFGRSGKTFEFDLVLLKVMAVLWALEVIPTTIYYAANGSEADIHSILTMIMVFVMGEIIMLNRIKYVDGVLKDARRVEGSTDGI